MKTTIEVDDGAYYVAKAYAAEHRCSLGKAISELILSPRPAAEASDDASRWPSLRVGKVLTVDTVKEMLVEDED